MSRPTIHLRNSEAKGLKLLVLDPDAERSVRHEARTELDPRLQRVDVYFVNTLEAARDVARKHGCAAAIVPADIDGADFVTQQVELRHAQPGLDVIALVDVPTIAQLRSARRAGGLMDFAPAATLREYEALTALLLQYVRERSKASTDHEALDFVESIHRTLLVDRADWKGTKDLSKSITNRLVLAYDLSHDETVSLMAAERLYFPELDSSQYSAILADDPFQLLPVLAACGSWGGHARRPSSTAGLVITAANHAADALAKDQAVETVIQGIRARPIHLLHPSLRQLSDATLTEALGQVQTIRKHG
jgi:hypothetical protein